MRSHGYVTMLLLHSLTVENDEDCGRRRRKLYLDFIFLTIEMKQRYLWRAVALVQWLQEETNVLKVVDLNPSTVYCKKQCYLFRAKAPTCLKAIHTSVDVCTHY